MNIAIIDADLVGRRKHRFPNLACMKLSGYYKDKGYNVELKLDYSVLQAYDKVFISKVFTDTPVPEEVLSMPNVEYGGTGFFYDKAPPLPPEIEHHYPDYSLYDEWVTAQLIGGAKPSSLAYYTDYSIGFMTRGCIRGCSFCVNKGYKKCVRHSPVSEFLNPARKYICLLDDNVFACPEWESIFEELNKTGRRFQFKQGLDERLLTDRKCEVLFSSNIVGQIIFAFDNIADKDIIIRKLQMIRRHTDMVVRFYVFCAYNHQQPDVYSDDFWLQDIVDTFERIKILMQYQGLPYLMRYKDYVDSPYKGMYITIGRWVNQPAFVKKKSFREYVAIAGASAIRYAEEFEKKHPEVASQYFDMRWSDYI